MPVANRDDRDEIAVRRADDGQRYVPRRVHPKQVEPRHARVDVCLWDVERRQRTIRIVDVGVHGLVRIGALRRVGREERVGPGDTARQDELDAVPSLHIDARRDSRAGDILRSHDVDRISDVTELVVHGLILLCREGATFAPCVKR